MPLFDEHCWEAGVESFDGFIGSPEQMLVEGIWLDA
jgi:hypothetical protein